MKTVYKSQLLLTEDRDLSKVTIDFILEQLSHYRQAAETAQTDLAAEKVVSSGLQNEV